MTSSVNTLGARLAQQPGGNDIWTAFTWCASIFVATYAAATTIHRIKISQLVTRGRGRIRMQCDLLSGAGAPLKASVVR